MARIKFTQLETLATPSVNLSAIVPIVQDNGNYTIALSSLPSSGGGSGSYDDSLLQAASGDWDSTYTTVNESSASWGTGGASYDHTLLESTSATWDNTSTVVQTNSTSWGADTGSAPIVQNLGVISGNYTLDLSIGESCIARFSTDTIITLQNAASGESGVLILGHDVSESTSTLSIAGAEAAEARVMVGDLANFASPGEPLEAGYDIGYNIGSVSWFNDGEDYYLYVSDIKLAADPLNLNRP